MMYEISAVQRALDDPDFQSILEADEWDRLAAEWIVDYLHSEGFVVAEAESES